MAGTGEGTSRPCSYGLRSLTQRNYKALANPRIPTARKTPEKLKPDQLFPVEVLEADRDRGLFCVHYTGYSRQYDEWREQGDIVRLNERGIV